MGVFFYYGPLQDPCDLSTDEGESPPRLDGEKEGWLPAYFLPVGGRRISATYTNFAIFTTISTITTTTLLKETTSLPRMVRPLPLHNVHFGKYVYLPTEQAETYLKSCVLINYSTYICLCLFGWKVNMILKETVTFKL